VEKKHLFVIFLSLAIALIVGCISPSRNVAESLPSFTLPIQCTERQNCYIMHYVDRDPSEKEVDFGCGRQTYNGHNGTDFGIPDLEAMKKGVAVISTAAGKVLRVRDGITDHLVENQTDKQAVQDIECGNGVVIDHGNGWQTQYCHLRKGSIVVEPGTEVEQGTVLGMVGASGLASFPHVHLTVRYQNRVIDPFVGPNNAVGCNLKREPLWAKTFDYVPTGLIRAGFAPVIPTQEELWQGKFQDNQLPQSVAALLFWVQVYGVLQGDIIESRLVAPNGQIAMDDKDTIEKSSRTWLSYIGKKSSPQRPLSPGIWRGEYQLRRGDRILVKITRELNLI
jgi:murein DD-endopeptidase MepM/ murein hydrolase activator NlpD